MGMEITMNPQETQPELVEIENYRIPVESRTLPAACMDGHLPMQIRPWKILYKKPLNIRMSQRFLARS